MAYSSLEIANAFLDIAKQNSCSDVTPMKLQKLVYFAQGWHLGVTNTPLIDEQIEAWKYGPVVPNLYQAAKKFGNKPITGSLTQLTCGTDLKLYEQEPRLDENEFARLSDFLNWIWKQYGSYSGVVLSNLTHQAGTPWHNTLAQYGGTIPNHTDISSEEIKKHFADQFSQLRQAKQK